ncbi:unnamed protein product [Ostreobium quekettii]|uniref:Heme-binding protein n=1 Tax=Ostreobium quekettii TaxID=121088 RepID=A0A8S1J381_9CHLO|nr:unnamed protein product [Ostreobium quekettii]
MHRMATVLCAIVAGMALWGGGVRADPPPFCNGLDCPAFSNVSAGDGVELRSYDPAFWVHTNVNESDVNKAKGKGLTRLDRYFFGYNDGDHYIPATAPIVTEMKTNATSYEFFYFIPFEYQESPPVPSSPDVFVDDLPAANFYVSTFGGYAEPELVALEAQTLLSKLKATGATVDECRYYVAEYDSPFQTTDRHNEIWYRDVAAPAPAPQPSPAPGTATAATVVTVV